MSRSITSYAQNFEDVMLWRALRHVRDGHYVDIGAQSPIIDSVSKVFHERGWKGVHVEPMPVYAKQLREDRPGDLVIQAMVGDTAGTMSFFEVPDTGLSTSRDDLAGKYSEAGREVTRSLSPVVTLDDVLEAVEGEIHWLKVDVEGGEAPLIKGWRGPVRPWVVVIESTLPMSEVQSFSHWEPDVLAKGYEFVYFDGLNRFYVSGEHPELKEAFSIGPNVFDLFELSGTATSSFAAGLRRHAATLNEKIADLMAEIARQDSEHRTEAAATGRSHAKEIQVWQDRVGALEALRVKQEFEYLDKLSRLRSESLERENELLAERAWALSHASRVQEELAATRAMMRDAIESGLRDVRADRDQAIAEADRLRGDVVALRSSTSWMVTAPLRGAARLARATLRLPTSAARRIDKAGRAWAMRRVFAILRRIDRSPTLRPFGQKMVATMPSSWIKRVRAWHFFAINQRAIPNDAIDDARRVSVLRVAAPPIQVDVDLGLSRAAHNALVRLRTASRAGRS